MGLSCDQITALLPVWDGTNCGAAHERVGRLVEEKQAEIAERIAELEAFAAQLDDGPRRAGRRAPGRRVPHRPHLLRAGVHDGDLSRSSSRRGADERVAMGLYAEHVLPRLINVCCGMKESRPLRQRVCAGLHGRVVEIGFGTGHNVPFYPDTVEAVGAVEPSDLSWRLARDRVSGSAVAIERSGLDGQSLPFTDDSFDSALSTWTLCTIPDPVRALTEVRRVLKPGGTLHFLEHGLAPDDKVRRWQHRLEPLNKRIAGGCHLTRQVTELVTSAGFTIQEVDVFYEDGAPKAMGADSLGIAVAS